MTIKPPKTEDISGLRRLWQEAFGDTEEFLDHFFGTAFALARCRCVMAGGQVAAALYWFSCEAGGQPIAYIYGVATSRKFRGQGLCRRLMADTHQHLKNLGYAGALLVPGDETRRQMYRAMGYADMTGIRRLSCEAGAPAPMETIDAKQYAALRREALPGDAVLQEGENLRFLEKIAQFYRGEDFLLCAVKEENRLVALELLGNAAAAPGILAALGCEEGIFTVPGEDEPFAMGIGFADDFRKPSYFAVAFD